MSSKYWEIHNSLRNPLNSLWIFHHRNSDEHGYWSKSGKIIYALNLTTPFHNSGKKMGKKRKRSLVRISCKIWMDSNFIISMPSQVEIRCELTQREYRMGNWIFPKHFTQTHMCIVDIHFWCFVIGRHLK